MVMSRDGSVIQAGMRTYSPYHTHERINHTVLGIVMRVYCSDDPVNQSAIPRADFKGSRCECEVLVINDGKDSSWRIPNVVIPPSASSGIDNYSESIPRAASQLIDGTVMDAKGIMTDVFKLDGDFCVVGFVGGHIEQPYIVSWWPHPSNRSDALTSNESGKGYLAQSRRFIRRFQGAKISITSEGSIFVDTCESNSSLMFGTPGRDGGTKREVSKKGGNIQIAVKPGRALEVNFNPPVAEPTHEPDLLQPNPPKGDNVRDDLLSRYLMSKDFISAVAGRVVQIMGNNDGTDHKNTVLLGENPDPTMGHLLLGEKVQDTFNALVANVNSLRTAYEAHFHASGTPTAPTSGPIDVTPPIAVLQGSLGGGLPPEDIYAPPTPQAGTSAASNMPDEDLSEVSVTE